MQAGNVSDGNVTATRAFVRDEQGAGAAIVFDRPRALRLVPNGLKTGGWRKLQIGRIEVEFPCQWTAGQTHGLGYRIEPLK